LSEPIFAKSGEELEEAFQVEFEERDARSSMGLAMRRAQSAEMR
jgi:hypothetical protein